MKISELPQPYKALAEKRRAENPDPECLMSGGFFWSDTPEGHEFWTDVFYSDLPPIPQQSMEELDMKWKQGDLITDGEKNRKVLGVCGDVLFLSVDNDFSLAMSHNYLQKELMKEGWRIKQEYGPTEMTVSEVAEKLGIDNLKIVKEK